ncbi:putative Serine dehydratase domain-containing protein [Seiridium cardinale]
MDYSIQHHKSYIGKPISLLPTPSLIVSLPIIKKNIAALHKDVEDLGIGFRPHVKTLKTTEITRLMIGEGKYKSAIASTLAEIRGLLPLCLYGFPVCPSYLPELARLRSSVRIILMIDSEQQIDALETFGAQQPWDVFIKLDVGSHRAGIATESPTLRRVVERANTSAAVAIYGFYCHAGHSYGDRTRESAEATLNKEITSVIKAASLLPKSRELVISVGATPTAHVVSSFKATVPANMKLELHAGNFPCNDLQQVSTSLVSEADQAVRIAAEVCSVYPERNEALVNAGAIALSRETSGYPGFGHIVEKPQWGLVRLSQEHGILATQEQGAVVADQFKVGDRVYLYCNHVCITAAAFFVFYVVDTNDVVVDTWTPWKGW